jgi:hypothetical protein
MATKPKKKPVVPAVTETPENYGDLEVIVEVAETPELPVTGVFPSAPIEYRIMQLLRRSGGVGGLHETISDRFPGEPLPSNDDEWIAVMNRLER